MSDLAPTHAIAPASAPPATGGHSGTARLLVKLAWRSLWRNKRRTQITLSSIGFGLSLAIFFGSLAEGTYEKAEHDATELLSGQLTVETPTYNDNPGPTLSLEGAPALREELARLPGVLRARSLVTAQGVASTGAGALGVALLGVDPALEVGHSPLQNKLVEGKMISADEPRGILVGRGLAERLRVQPGKKVVLTSTDVQGNVSSELFRVSGIFRLGSDELDTYLVQAQLPLVQKMLGLRADQVGQIGLFLAPGEDVPAQVRAEAQALLDRAHQGSLRVRSWEETVPALAAWMKVDRSSNNVTRMLIVFLVMFTILNTLLMSVLERGHEFAVLLALGTPRRQLQAQVLLEVAMMAVLGCTLGFALGLAAAFWGQHWGIDLTRFIPEGATAGGMALDPIIHCKVSFPAFVKLTLFVFATTLLLGVWPMRRAGQIELAASLRTQR